MAVGLGEWRCFRLLMNLHRGVIKWRGFQCYDFNQDRTALELKSFKCWPYPYREGGGQGTIPLSISAATIYNIIEFFINHATYLSTHDLLIRNIIIWSFFHPFFQKQELFFKAVFWNWNQCLEIFRRFLTLKKD